jgi:hypothetical protein
VYDGTSDNFKVCSDSTCAYGPSPKRTPYDKCDVTMQALEAGDQEDIRSNVFCEYKVREAGGWFRAQQQCWRAAAARIKGDEPGLKLHAGVCAPCVP